LWSPGPGPTGSIEVGRVYLGRILQGVLVAIPLALTLALCGCGGGSGFVQPAQPPPPPQDFTITLSSSSLTVAQGASSAGISVSITGQNGFNGTVQVTLAGLPSGVASNPSSPFGAAAGASVSVVFGATANAATGNFTITAQGTSGSLSHMANLALTVLKNTGPPLPRTTFARTDSTTVLDDPPGEPHHRHIVYDPANKHLFVANSTMNRVEVFSTTDASRVAQIQVPGASSADLSADGATVWIGTVLEQIVAIDTISLRVKARYALQGLQPLPNTTFDRPEELLALSNGKLLIRLRQSEAAESLLALWDPASNVLTNLTSAEPPLFQSGLGAMARTSDHTKVLVAANDMSGELATFDSNGNVLVGPHGLGQGTIPLVTANADGSIFAAAFVSNGTAQVALLDSSLNPVGSPAVMSVQGLAFSRDGKSLFASNGIGSVPAITVFSTQSLQALGEVADAAIQGIRSEIEDADETQLLFGIGNRGVSFVDASNPAKLPASVPTLASAPSLRPPEGPNLGGTSTTLSGQNFESTALITFGSQAAANVNVMNSTQLQATSPPSVFNGAMNMTAYFPSGWLDIAPDAFSYGPQILQILPNAGSKNGGDTVQIYGYGFGTDATKLKVIIGGTNATVQKVENVTTVAGALGLDASYPYPIERITLSTPAGTAGKADITVTSAAGAITASSAFQFLQNLQFLGKPGFYTFLQYDKKRQFIYLSNIDHVDVLDLGAGQFHPKGIEPPGGPPPNAGLRGLALTPDASQLVVADFGAQNVYLFNPDTGSGSTVPVGGVPGFTNSGPARVAATSTQAVFVGLSGEGGSSGSCSACLGQMDLTANPPTIQPAPEPEVASLTGAPLVQGGVSGNRVFISFSSDPSSPVAFWDASSPNQFTTVAANTSATDLGAAADGTMFALQTKGNGTTEIRGADLTLAAVPASPELAQISGRMNVPGLTVHPSGALIYQPFLTGMPGAAGTNGGIDIIDAHSGVLRMRVILPQQLLTAADGFHGSFLATDENGQRLFAIASTDGTPQKAGVSVVTLAAVPLGIGTITPATAAAAGGTTLTIRGSGFQSGTKVSIGGQSATVTFVDINTLSVVTPAVTAGPQQLMVTNPDGESTSLDAAITAN
jgi:IPT/TIG domain